MKWYRVGDVQTWRMLPSGREIHAFWPGGIGSPSLGVGRLPARGGSGVATSSVPETTRKCAWLNSSQIVLTTPEAYAPGWALTASIPAFRSTA